jgi:cystathionine gamma-synthase
MHAPSQLPTDTQLASLCLAKFGRADELCILLPSPRVANQARDFLARQGASSRIVEFVVCPSTTLPASAPASHAQTVQVIELQILLFGKDNWKHGKAFWQHTGDYISSRCADRALAFLGGGDAASGSTPGTLSATPTTGKNMYSKNRHYARMTSSQPPTPTFLPTPSNPNPPTTTETITDDLLTSDLTTYLEERYGRNLPLFNAPLAKQALRRRIAGGLLPSDEDFGKVADVTRGGGVTEDDVYLFPCGMSAIWHAHDIVRIARRRAGPEGKSVCYG